MSQLFDIYTEILQAAGLNVKPDGAVFKGDERYFIKGKPLLLPKSAHTSRADAQDKIFFHPLAEAAAKGESDVLEDLRGRFAQKLNLSTAKLTSFFLELVTGTTKVTLDPEQIKVMQLVKGIGEKEARDILEVIKATTKGEGKRTPLIKLYLSRRPTEIGGVKFHRSCTVLFPLYAAAKEELATKTKAYSLLGVSINKKGLEGLCSLFEYMYPGIEKDQGAYNQGSNSQIAPFADALFRGVGGIVGIFNEQVNLYKNVSEVEKLRIPSDWLDVLDNMDSLFPEINMIPLQPNADGKARISDVQTSELAQRPRAVHAEPVPQGQVHITQAPISAPVAPYQAAAAPVVAEQEFIRTAHGIKRNPNFMRSPWMAGAPRAAANALDPYANQVIMPAMASHAPMPSMGYQVPPASVYQGQQQMGYQGLPGMAY